MYYISNDRYYELKDFCLQYPEWKKRYVELSECVEASKKELENCRHKILLVENASRAADLAIGDYILKGVTESLSYDCLSTLYNIPCGREMYYDRYRKFFWYLSLTQ